MPKIGRYFMPGFRRSIRFQMESGDFPVPVGQWKFGKNTGAVAYDSSPEGNNGTIHGATWVKGWLGPGLSYGGDDDYVRCGATGSIGSGLEDEFTAVARIYPVEAKVENILGYSGVSADRNFEFRLASGRNLQIGISDGSDSEYLTSTVKPSLNAWSFTAVRYKKGELLSVTLGAVTKDTTPTIDLNMKAKAMYIGSLGTSGQLFHGILDEVILFDELLIERQILELYYGIR